MRVHELAKLYELNYKEVLEICKKSKVDVKDSPHASLTDDACRVIVPLIKSFKKSKEGNNAVTTEEKPSKKAAPVKAKKTEKKKEETVKETKSSADLAPAAEKKKPLLYDKLNQFLEQKKGQTVATEKAAKETKKESAEPTAPVAPVEVAKAKPQTESKPEPTAPVATAAAEKKESVKEEPKPVNTPQKPVESVAKVPETVSSEPQALQKVQTPTAEPTSKMSETKPLAEPRKVLQQPQQQAQQPVRHIRPGQTLAPQQNSKIAQNRPMTPRPAQGEQGHSTANRRPAGFDPRHGTQRPDLRNQQHGNRPYQSTNDMSRGQRPQQSDRNQNRDYSQRPTRPFDGRQQQSQQHGNNPHTNDRNRPSQRNFQQGDRPVGERYSNNQQGTGNRSNSQGFTQRRPPFNTGDRRPQTSGQNNPRYENRDSRPVKLTEDNLPQIGIMRGDGKATGRNDRRDKKSTAGKGKLRPSQIFEISESANPKRKAMDTGAKSTRDLLVSASKSARGANGAPKKKKRYYEQQREAAQQSMPTSVLIDGEMTVGDFADKCMVMPEEVIKRLILNGQMLTINQTMSTDLMELIALDLGIELEVAAPKTDYDDIAPYIVEDNPEHMKRRAPVVTIMGHVDHGKTTLLDRIRMSNVVDDEFGGITQHIGAYHVSTSRGMIAFLDTPGHEAFTAMRARGAAATDIVILVVSADDGFMPQTIEAINHSQAANVPIIVAVNKIDLPSADPAKARQAALQHNLVPEEFGGDTMFIDISAKKNINIDSLLESVALQADLLDLKADPDKPAVGVVVESRMDPLRGAVATILIQSGTLNQGDAFVCGAISGNVRAMNDDMGRPIRTAGPSVPVEIIGLSGSPDAGESFYVVPDEKIAREIAERRTERRRQHSLSLVRKHITLESIFDQLSEGKVKELGVILKADVQGSVEALNQSLMKIGTETIRIKVLHSGVGGINESDINLADASNAIVIGFNVRPDTSAEEHAKRTGVEIKLYRVIFDLMRDVREALTGMLDARHVEKITGHARIDQVFRVSRIGSIAGCFVTDGEIARDAKVRLVRDNKIIYEGRLGSLKRFKDDAKKVTTNQECGLTIENYNDIKEGDVVESYIVEDIKQTLEELEKSEHEQQ